MGRISNRDRILSEGLKVVLAHGYAGASVRDIVQAAGVPQGSFTNHFTSKEAFGLEILELYFANGQEVMAKTLRNDELPPLKRLRAYIDANRDRQNEDGMRNGCLFGNFTAEASDHSEVIRARLIEIFEEVEASLMYCLKAAVKAGCLPSNFKSREVAAFIVSSLQGATLLAKAQRSPAPIDRFKEILFSTVLR
ncbi:TetR/AcrR family transcriptional repressor of nem operon [Nitrobacteraceae bacterium AZCC 2161]